MKSTRNLTLFLQQSGSVYHVTTELSGRFIYANELYRKIFFHGGNDFHDDFFADSLLPEDVELYRNAIDECIRFPGENVCADLRRTRSDGSVFWIRWEFCCFPDGENPGAVEAIGTDITERKRAENERREVQERLTRERYLLRTLIDHLPDAIFVKDVESRHIINNKASLELLGASSEEETIGKTVIDFFGPDSGARLIRKDKEVMLDPNRLDISEELVVNKKGQKKWLLTTKVPLKEDGHGVIGLVGISRDITEQRKFQESLRLSIERFNIVSKATNDAIWDHDLLNDTTFWNDAVTLLFGYTQKEIDADPMWWENHIHPQDCKRILAGMDEHIRDGREHWQDEYLFRCKDGSYKSILDRGFVLFNDQHKPYRMIGAMTDITERKRLQDELASNNLARQRQVTEAAIMAQEKERAEMGRELHDNINQILSTTKMYLDMALTEKDISEELIIKSHENISSAIEEIRILSKSLVPPSLGDIGLKEAILEMINNLKISQKIDIRLRTTGLGKSAIPKNIQLMVFRVVQEQMNNVLKHSKATEVEIRIALTKEVLTLAIADNGVGFDPKKRMKGIGLMNITSRAEVHQGTVDIISSPGNGCTLKITIPVKA